MKNLDPQFRILRAADGVTESGPPDTKDRAIKTGGIKVRATLNPVRSGDTVIEPDQYGKGGKVVKAAKPVEISEKEFKRLGPLVTKVGLALLCAALTFAASAQQYGQPDTSWTLISAGAVTTPMDVVTPHRSNYTAVACTKYEELYLSVTAYPSNTSSGQFFIPWALGGDGSTYNNVGATVTNFVTLNVGTGGVPVSWGTNLYVGSAGYFKTGIIGATNSTLTNVTFKVYGKPKRDG